MAVGLAEFAKRLEQGRLPSVERGDSPRNGWKILLPCLRGIRTGDCMGEYAIADCGAKARVSGNFCRDFSQVSSEIIDTISPAIRLATLGFKTFRPKTQSLNF